MPIGVLAHLKVKPDQCAVFERAFADYQRKVRTLEPGNLFFQLHRARDEAGSYTVMEQYRDEAALAAHRASEHYKAIPATFGAVMAGPPDIRVFDSVES
ncbi:MAG: putative quinol monooxygenase [Gammaproteobacteria bacterium]